MCSGFISFCGIFTPRFYPLHHRRRRRRRRS